MCVRIFNNVKFVPTVISVQILFDITHAWCLILFLFRLFISSQLSLSFCDYFHFLLLLRFPFNNILPLLQLFTNSSSSFILSPSFCSSITNPFGLLTKFQKNVQSEGSIFVSVMLSIRIRSFIPSSALLYKVRLFSL